MALHLKIDPDRVLQYDYGYDIRGEVYENARMTRPHDLTQYERVTLRISPSGLGSYTAFVREEALVGPASGDHTFTWRIPEGSFYFAGYYKFFVSMHAIGLERTSLPTTLLIQQTSRPGVAE